MKIDYIAADSNLMAVADGAVATIRVGDAGEIVGIVTNHTSKDGYTVSTFGVDSAGHAMPPIVMTKDSPLFKFDIIAANAEEFFAADNRGEFFNFAKQVCAHQSQQFEDYAGLQCAYWLAKNYRQIDDANVVEAAEVVQKARIHFYDYVRATRLGAA